MIRAVFGEISYFTNYLFNFKILKKPFITLFKPGHLPRHIGFIMDGNRRFAKENGILTSEGHRAGVKALADALESCFDIGVKEVSIYAFSIENFHRAQSEIDDLLVLLKEGIKNLSEESWIQKYNVHIRIVGNKSLIDPELREDLDEIEESSKDLKSAKFINVCFAYTARDEMTHSIREVVSKREAKSLSKKDINERVISENFYIGEESQPLDLLIRTSGHSRISDFLLWQCASNCKIIFSDTLWPYYTFWELYRTLLVWSFEQTLVYNRHLCWKFFQSPANLNVQQLPECPPFASVGQATQKP